MKFLFATMFLIGLGFGFFMLGAVYGGLFYGLASEETAILVTLTSEIICFLLCVPLIFGYFSFCIKLIRGKDAQLSELFEYYSSVGLCMSAYSYFLRLLPALLFKYILPLVLIVSAFESLEMVAPYFLPELLETSAATRILQGLFFIPAITVVILCFYLSGNDIVRFLHFCSGHSNIGIIYRKGKFFALRLSIFPLYALSILSFGVLFIAYSFPITVIIYSLFLGLDNEDTQKTAVFTAASAGSAAMVGADSDISFSQRAYITEDDNNGDTAVFDINDFKENN